MSAAVLRNITKTYRVGSVEIAALRDIDLEIRSNRFTAIAGPSGSGKTTLLNVIGCIDRPDQGELLVGETTVGKLSDDALSDFRAAHLGFVFQSFNLLPTFTAEENVAWPLEFVGVGRRESRRRASRALERVGIPDAARGRRPAELSGGEQQRVAIARALVGEPRLVLADEPTGNLDSHTGRSVLELLRSLNREQRVTVIMVTHGDLAAGVAGRTVELRDGRLVNGASERETRRPDIADESAELSWVVWRDAQSVTEWEAVQLTAWGVSLGGERNGSMAEAV